MVRVMAINLPLLFVLLVGKSHGWISSPPMAFPSHRTTARLSKSPYADDRPKNPVIFVKVDDTGNWGSQDSPPPATEETWRWCTNFVVPLNLCPWAAASVKSQGGVKVYLVDRAHDMQSAVEDASSNLIAAIKSGEVDANLAISFIVTTEYWEFGSFYGWFLDLEEAFIDSSFDEVTLAPFHPDWLFQDDEAELSFEKKSPYPTVSVVSRFVIEKAGVEATSAIAGHNKAILLDRGFDQLQELYQNQVLLFPNREAPRE